MSDLEAFIIVRGIDGIEAMNFLQDQGIVSDNCVMADSVSDKDFPAAKAALESHEARKLATGKKF